MKSRELRPEHPTQSVARYASAGQQILAVRISQSSTELWPKIGFDHIWRSVGHLESDALAKKS